MPRGSPDDVSMRTLSLNDNYRPSKRDARSPISSRRVPMSPGFGVVFLAHALSSCTPAGPDGPHDGDVRTAGGRAGGRGGREHLRGDGGHSRCRAVRVQNLHALHPRAQRGVSFDSDPAEQFASTALGDCAGNHWQLFIALTGG